MSYYDTYLEVLTSCLLLYSLAFVFPLVLVVDCRLYHRLGYAV